MTSLIFWPFTKMAFCEEDKHVIKNLQTKQALRGNFFLKSFLIKAGLVVDWIRLFARLIVLELWNVFSAVSVREMLELLTKLKKPKQFWARKICRKHTVLKDKLLRNSSSPLPNSLPPSSIAELFCSFFSGKITTLRLSLQSQCILLMFRKKAQIAWNSVNFLRS